MIVCCLTGSLYAMKSLSLWISLKISSSELNLRLGRRMRRGSERRRGRNRNNLAIMTFFQATIC